MSINNKKKSFALATKKYLCYLILSKLLFSYSVQAKIYYSAKVAGPVINVFSINEQGDINKITDNNRWRDLEHNVSVNGLVSFSSNRKKSDKISRQRQAEDYNIYLLDPKNNQLSQITTQPSQEQQPSFSPTGTKLAFIRVDKSQQSLVVYDLKTKTEKTLATSKVIYDFSWSPNGKKIVFVDNTKDSANLITVNVETLISDTLLTTTTNNNSKKMESIYVAPSWSPNGKYIAYIVHPLKQGISRTLHLYQLDAKRSQLISQTDIQVQAPLTWSKNSDTLLYSALVNYQQFYDESIHKKVYVGGMHIFNSDLLGNNQQLTTGDHLFKQPIFSPDESQIAYLYADKLNARTLQLKRMKFDGSEVKTLGKNIAQNAKIQWR